jgi:hypothetical protein
MDIIKELSVIDAEIYTGGENGRKGLCVHQGSTDPIGDVPLSISFEHHQVHEGYAFQCTIPYAALGSGSSFDLLISVPVFENSLRAPHIIPIIYATAQTLESLYEAPTVTGTGTATESVNRDRGATNIAKTVIRTGATFGALGKLLDQRIIGDKNQGGYSNQLDEWILKSNTNYLFRVTAQAASNNIVVKLNWYEDEND